MQNNDSKVKLFDREQSSNTAVQQQDTFAYTDSIVALKTPVLFSTDHGIHIRHTVFDTNFNLKSSSSTVINNQQQYRMYLCDLENFRGAGGRQMKSIGLTPEPSVLDNTDHKVFNSGGNNSSYDSFQHIKKGRIKTIRVAASQSIE